MRDGPRLHDERERADKRYDEIVSIDLLKEVLQGIAPARSPNDVLAVRNVSKKGWTYEGGQGGQILPTAASLPLRMAAMQSRVARVGRKHRCRT